MNDQDNKDVTSPDQIAKWLRKLERESWQLELLVSAFTIFLLIEAAGVFSDFFDSLPYKYNLNVSLLAFIYIFIGLLGLSLKALTVFLIVHLLLRGFWIGAIGLRSVQSTLDISKLNYSPFFTDKLSRRIISLDDLVIRLDEICSVIFSFSFLFISMLLAFGLYLLFFGSTALILLSIAEFTAGWLSTAFAILATSSLIAILTTGLIYLIDYFTLGFFKKFKVLGRIYYPIYRFYSIITISAISNSIYYYLISKFSKRKIRIIYLIVSIIFLFNWIINYDQFQYFTERDDHVSFSSNYYASLRPMDDYIRKVSIQSHVVDGPYLQLFLRYDPADNTKIRGNCPDYVPFKNDGINARFKFKARDGKLQISAQDFEGEDKESLLSCLSSIYEVTVNDSLCQHIQYFFYEHPAHKQPGLVTQLSTQYFKEGENMLSIKKVFTSKEDSTTVREDYVYIPFWFVKRK